MTKFKIIENGLHAIAPDATEGDIAIVLGAGVGLADTDRMLAQLDELERLFDAVEASRAE